MRNVIRSLVFAGLAFFRTRRQPAVEILALRHQLGVLRRSVKRPQLTKADRGVWVLLSRFWADWSDALIIVKAGTVIQWHRAGFRRYWTWRSRHTGGRPRILCHVLFVFVVLAHDRRRIVSINVTSSPSASRAANQIVQAFPWETAPRYCSRC